MRRIFLFVLDSFGIGFAPDADKFGDVGANTLRSISRSKNFRIKNLAALGLCNIDGIDYFDKANNTTASYARLKEVSAGKDTTIGHWEIAGLTTKKPLPTYPNGFPKEIIKEFERRTGRGVICNKPYSGTKVIYDYGKDHIETGSLIVYTSADSVFQIAAHEDFVSVKELYHYCEIAREILCGDNAVGRVIARPFKGEWPDFKRTENRHDFSLKPHSETMLDAIKNAGLDTICIGKISDIFAGCGVTEKITTKNNTDGMEKAYLCLDKDFSGLCFINLVDFDMLYGHRNDVDGYAAAISEFDDFLEKFIPHLKNDDVMIITADHGCDPAFDSTDHTREYVPMLVYGSKISSENLGTINGFDCIAATVADLLGVDYKTNGESLAEQILKVE